MNYKKQKGISIYLVVVILSVVLAIILGVNTVLTQQLVNIREMGYGVSAFYAADSGVEEAILRINYKDYGGFLPGLVELENGASFTTKVFCCDKSDGSCFYKNPPREIPVEEQSCPDSLEEDPNCLAETGSPHIIKFCIRVIGEYQGVKKAIEVKI